MTSLVFHSRKTICSFILPKYNSFHQSCFLLPKRNLQCIKYPSIHNQNINKSKFLIYLETKRHYYKLPLFRNRLVRMSNGKLAFLIGFVSMTGLCIIEFLYDRYRGDLNFLNFFQSNKKHEEEVDFLKNKFVTKFASILSASDVPKIQPSRVVPGVVNLSNIKITLFQYQTCPFCCKVRSFLDYYGLPYEVVEVNPVLRQQIKFSKNYRKVPLILVSQTENFDNEKLISDEILQINDSTLIVSTLTSYLLSRKPNSKHNNESLTTLTRWYLNSHIYLNEDENNNHLQSSTFKAKTKDSELVNRYFLMIGDVDSSKYEKMDPPLAEERRWRRWVDDHFVHVLSPNIYRTYDESLNSFNYFSDVGNWSSIFQNWERLLVVHVGAIAMYFVSKGLKKKYGLKEDVRQSLYDSCNYWLKGIGPNRQFMGGDQPNLADLAVYGSLSSIEGCEAFKDLMRNTKMSRWYFNVKTMVEEHHGSKDIKTLL